MQKAVAVIVLLMGSSTAFAASNTTIVALAGANYPDPVTAMNDMGTWCGTPSAANPCLLKIMPGVYDLGASALQMHAYVDVEGSGENATRIKGNGGIVVGGAFEGPADLRSLTVENYGTGNTLNLGAWVPMEQTISQVTVTSSSGPGVIISFASASPATVILKDVKITTPDLALWCGGSGTVKVRNSDVRTTSAAGQSFTLGMGGGNTVCSGTLTNVAVSAQPQGTAVITGGPVDVRDSTISGGSLVFSSSAKIVNSVATGALFIAGTTKLENTEVTGPFTRQGTGLVQCRANFDVNLNAFSCPTWR
jgi:hypothetical protein